ncbi:MAG: hypothetical protein ABL906_11620 [Sideroxydans sp.]
MGGMRVGLGRNKNQLANFLSVSRGVRSLSPFLLVSLLLHGVFFWLFSAWVRPAPLTPPQPLQITLSLIQPHVFAAPVHLAASPPALLTRRAGETTSSAPAEVEDWAALAHQIAREDALQAERKIEADAKLKLNTPLGQLQASLRHSHKETRLANGMVKWEGEMGAVCFNEPPPYFAWDAPNLFKMARTCP